MFTFTTSKIIQKCSKSRLNLNDSIVLEWYNITIKELKTENLQQKGDV